MTAVRSVLVSLLLWVLLPVTALVPLLVFVGGMLLFTWTVVALLRGLGG